MAPAVTRHTFFFSPGQGESGFPKLLNRIPPRPWAWVSPTQSQWPLTSGLCNKVLRPSRSLPLEARVGVNPKWRSCYLVRVKRPPPPNNLETVMTKGAG